MGKKNRINTRKKQNQKLIVLFDTRHNKGSTKVIVQCSPLVQALTWGYNQGGLPKMYGIDEICFYLDPIDILNIALSCKELVKFILPHLNPLDSLFIPKLVKELNLMGAPLPEESIEGPDYELPPYEDEGEPIFDPEDEEEDLDYYDDYY